MRHSSRLILSSFLSFFQVMRIWWVGRYFFPKCCFQASLIVCTLPKTGMSGIEAHDSMILVDCVWRNVCDRGSFSVVVRYRFNKSTWNPIKFIIRAHNKAVSWTRKRWTWQTFSSSYMVPVLGGFTLAALIYMMSAISFNVGGERGT